MALIFLDCQTLSVILLVWNQLLDEYPQTGIKIYDTIFPKKSNEKWDFIGFYKDRCILFLLDFHKGDDTRKWGINLH